jgi:hypothetical protein
MNHARYTTVPLRCPACGAQTHKTLETVLRDKAFQCDCGERTQLEEEAFAEEIKKSEAEIKDFGRKR